ncbi:MAG TPA: nicotinate-nucleotide adenylyltransferase [bacterium]|nr:nicotinate-nucleotide adenylyltransferase [bacterium]
MRTGLFGGTFDPIHTGHLILAETVRADVPLDRIVFIPAGIPPHKPDTPVGNPSQRLAMVRLAVQDHPDFYVSECEIAREGPSYTVDTLLHLRSLEIFRNDRIFLIIGADNLVELHTWKDPGRIFDLAEVLCLSRPGDDIRRAAEPYRSRVRMIRAPLISISGTEIRERVQTGRSIRYRVPDPVADYIAGQGLYLR